MIIEKDHKIAPFIKEIFLLKSDGSGEHKLPFYADGYPGIIYSQTKSGVKLLPHNKFLPDFFLYGQTIEPIELQIQGTYTLIVFQLYPFATRILLDIAPKEINDECFDLKQIQNVDTEAVIASLKGKDKDKDKDNLDQVQLISDYITDLVKNASTNSDNNIKLAVSTIINTKGTILIKDLREQLFITERTFERRFTKEIGVTPKQFAKIVQFNFSLNQIQDSDYTNLTNIAYENGFTDQSHFIKTFKKYTGETPKQMLSKLA